ncbi:hypothetical protein RJ640_015910 [Escallonia rubra]|uniref:CCHC-type domain-containing protein n=1 Tax=Escallonia rubra TaxID=112253 RepID=A0AA88QU90_9ASTE|nr:hypothetical protein RJ640_015910 [Escallonia rubra]
MSPRVCPQCSRYRSWSRYSMEHEEKNDVIGEVPEFGAIFMSNMETKRECFRRNLFGLQSSKANFVKQVSSDGAMNIVPDAFSSSGKQFPAQVCFTQIWYCSPLSENEFRDAIRENYFSAKKFNFGLSEDQGDDGSIIVQGIPYHYGRADPTVIRFNTSSLRSPSIITIEKHSTDCVNVQSGEQVAIKLIGIEDDNRQSKRKARKYHQEAKANVVKQGPSKRRKLSASDDLNRASGLNSNGGEKKRKFNGNCYVCDKPGHCAKDCYSRKNKRKKVKHY